MCIGFIQLFKETGKLWYFFIVKWFFYSDKYSFDICIDTGICKQFLIIYKRAYEGFPWHRRKSGYIENNQAECYIQQYTYSGKYILFIYWNTFFIYVWIFKLQFKWKYITYVLSCTYRTVFIFMVFLHITVCGRVQCTMRRIFFVAGTFYSISYLTIYNYVFQ